MKTPHTIDDLTRDPHNRRQRTARGARMLADSLGRVGAGRSVVIDETNTVLAGNGVIEAAAEVGITKVQVVDVDGTTVVAVRRSGLSDDQKRELAMFDNRTGELAEWSPTQIEADRRAGLDLEPFFTTQEQRKILHTVPTGKEPAVKEVLTSEVGDQFWIAIRGPLKSQALALHRLKEVMREIEGVAVELGTVQAVEAWTPTP